MVRRIRKEVNTPSRSVSATADAGAPVALVSDTLSDDQVALFLAMAGGWER
jgi:hypothetical protein